jgi:hypothetical protein
MVPVPSQLFHRVARSGDSNPSAGSRPSIPHGDDSHDQRLALDNSRAGPSPYAGPDANGTLNLQPELMQLLSLRSAVVDLNPPAEPVFAPSFVMRPVAPAVFHHDIPMSSRRFLSMNVVELLEEVMQRAVGEGPPDDVGSPGVQPEHYRLSTMAFALQLTPARQHDALVLRNAGMALNTVFYDYATLLEEMRIKRPDLAPVVPRWRADITRAAILRAVTVPLGADGEPQYAPHLYDPVVMPLRQPFASYLPLLEWRLGEHQRHTFVEQSRQYFSRISTPLVRASPRENRVLGAASNELEGSPARTLRGGTVVFRCAENELFEHLRMIPSGLLTQASTQLHWVGGKVVRPPSVATYPDRGSGTTIKRVQWQNAAGETRPVIVNNWNGVHSFSLDAGNSWRPTGGLASAAFDDLRADGWRQLMADRWHGYKKGASVAWKGAGGL